MGFKAKMLFVTETEEKAEKIGPDGQTTCVVWEDTFSGIDFGRITRLEKLSDKRLAHITWTPFRRAGICVIDCLFRNLFANFDKNTDRWFAPEILVDGHLPLYVYIKDKTPPEPTKKIGGGLYLDCSFERLTGGFGNEKLIPMHNAIVTAHRNNSSTPLSQQWLRITDPPLLWMPCDLLVDWLTAEEEQKTECWKALVQDRVSLAIFLGWKHALREMGEVGARAVFRFS